jgi:hypothetical protein
MKQCEKCGADHDGSFGSGRFCSRACANKRVYDDKRRDEIYAKVSKTLTITNAPKRAARFRFRECPICNTLFAHYKNKTCSDKCAKLASHSPEVCERQSHDTALRIATDPTFSKRLKTIRCEFDFQGKMIRCDSKVEYVCLDFLIKTFDIVLLERCDFIIPFEFENRVRHYVPDFKAVTADGKTYIVEAKCEFISKHLRNKWRYYYETIPFKREALKKFCDELGYTDLYFNRSMHRKFYETCKPRLTE